MGAEDMRRQAPNVERMQLLGAEVRPVEFGTKTLKEATSEAIRDWITNVETTHYLIGSCVGPAPYPELVRDLQRVIGDEAREQMLAAEGRLPDAVVACVGGGSNAIGSFYGFLDDADGPPDRCRGGGRREPRRGPHRHPPRRALLGARRRRRADRRRALDLGRARLPRRRPRARRAPRLGPRRSTCPAPTRRRSPPSHRLAETEGIIPALESSHALARALELDAELVVVCLSGRGDKDLAEVLAHRMTALVDLPRLRAGDARARRGGGRRRRRHRSSSGSRSPTRSPRARRSAWPPSGRSRAGCEPPSASSASRRRAPRVEVPLVPMTYAAILEAFGYERFVAETRAAGATSAIVVDLPVEEHPEVPRIQLVAPTSTEERIALCAASRPTAGSTSSRSTGTTGAREAVSPALAGLVERARAATDKPLYAGFGISTPAHAAAVAGLADGVDRRLAGGAGRPRRARSRCATTSRSLREAIDGGTPARELGLPA